MRNIQEVQEMVEDLYNRIRRELTMTTLQEKIIAELKVKPVIDPQEEIRKSVDFMKEYARKHSFLNGFVLGISGGQDSTLVGKLAQIAVDELNEEDETDRYQFIAVRLPYGTQFDEDDCQDALDFIKPTKYIQLISRNRSMQVNGL